jgi:hypothetical protein
MHGDSRNHDPADLQAPMSVEGRCQPETSRPRKAKQHRKRHALPGPAGLLFQQSQTPLLNTSKRQKCGIDPMYSDSPPRSQCQDEDDDRTPIPKTIDFSQNVTAGISFYSPAWMVMQIELGFQTPSLQSHLSEAQKYKILRPCYPEASYYLVPDIASGKADWNLSPRSLLVLVQTSQALTDNLWTVSLMDETCAATVEAWIQPSLVKKEQQHNYSHQTIIQPGLVWLIQDATIMLVSNKDRKKKTERMLLIKQENIQKVWSPSQADAIGEAAYREWVDKRNTMTVQASLHMQAIPSQEDVRQDHDRSAILVESRIPTPQTKINTIRRNAEDLDSASMVEACHPPIRDTTKQHTTDSHHRPDENDDVTPKRLSSTNTSKQPTSRSVSVLPETANGVTQSLNASTAILGDSRSDPLRRQALSDPAATPNAANKECTPVHLTQNDKLPIGPKVVPPNFSHTQLSNSSKPSLTDYVACDAAGGGECAQGCESQSVNPLPVSPTNELPSVTITGLWKSTDMELMDLLDESDTESFTDKAADTDQENVPNNVKSPVANDYKQHTTSIFQASAGLEIDGFSDEDD